MITDELLRFIEGRLQEGASRQDIENTLSAQGGWAKQDIDEAFNALSKQASVPPPSAPVAPAAPPRPQAGTAESPRQTKAGFQGGAQVAAHSDPPLFPILFGVGILVAGIALFVVFGPGLGARYSASSDIDGFLKDFIQASQDIERFGYEVSISAVQEPRDENIEPLTISDSDYETNLTQTVEQLNMMARLLPSRFSGDMTFSGVVGLEQEEGKLPDTQNSLTINADWGDMTIALDAEALVKDEDIYARVNRFPPLLFIDIEPIREQWVQLPAEEYQDSMTDILDVYMEEGDDEALAEFPKLLAEAVSEHNPFILKESPRQETLESGRGAVGYSLGINGETFGGFYESLQTKLMTLLEGKELEAIESELESHAEFFETEEFLEFIEYLNEHTEFVIWMDEATGYPVQYSSEVVFVPNPDMSEDMMPFGSGAVLEDKQLRLTSVTTLTDINQNINIQAPQDFMTYNEASELLFGQPFGEGLE